MSNFAFLHHPEWAFLAESAGKAEELAHADARASCFYARRTLELAVAWVYKHDRTLRLPYQDTLSALIHEPTFRQALGDALFTKARLIKDLGNAAVHSTRRILPADAVHATRELFHVCFWLTWTYGQAARPDASLAFDLALLPPASAAPAQTRAQLQQLEADMQAKDAHLAALLADKTALGEALAQLQAEIAAIKAANAQQPDTHDYSEAETRRLFIDTLLREAGWDLDPARHFEVEVTGMPNAEGKGHVDYVLWGDDGQPLALIEAKRTTVSPAVGQQQAKLYADCLEQQYGQRPLIFYTNGYQHWLWDDLRHPPRPVQGFYKKAELALAIQRRTSRKPLAAATIDPAIVERHYQLRAIRRVGEAFEVENSRKALLVMATGSGKTRTVIALADVLMRCNWAKRVLFLADRVALVKQAVNAFKVHLPDAAPIDLTADKTTEGRVYVSTYPTMMGLIDEAQDGQRRFGVGHFDLIVVDEAHRSVYQKYRAIFEYFDALLVGLTATPKDEIHHDTYGLFALEKGVPTDAYGLEEAVNDGHLVPPVAISVPLKFQREGIKYDELSEDEKEAWDELEWPEEDAARTAVSAEEVNNWLFNTDTVDKVLETLMTKGQKVAGGDRLGKTIIFAKNNDHAEFIEQRFNANYPHLKGHFARVVTYQTKYAQSVIDDFANREKAPHIAISVDMLDTGIDVPEVVNLVFFKVVRAKTKFWQMVGRGTRLCKDLFGPGQDKKNFFIFDFCQNLEFFSLEPEGGEGAVAEPLGTRLFKARLQLLVELDQRPVSDGVAAEPAAPPYGAQLSEAQVRVETAALLHRTVAAMNVDNFLVRPQREHVERFAKAEAWQTLGPADLDALKTRVAGLPTELPDEGEEARRFDLLMLRLQLASLQGAAAFVGLQAKAQEVARALDGKGAIPAIQAELVFIQQVAGDEWWVGVTVPMLEAARRRLRGLIRLLPKGERVVVYTNFTDELGEAEVVALPQVTAGLDLAKFKEKARVFLRAHEASLPLQRLRRNLPLTPTDLEALEQLLLEAGGNAALLAEARAQCEGLGLFIRSLVGLDREAAMQAFSAFLGGGTATPNQIEFIHLVVEELTQTGVMAPERLFQSPYTDVAAQGPLGIFPPARAAELVEVLEGFRRGAVG